MRQKQLGKVVTPCFTLVSDYKQLDTRSYFITTNFHTKLKPQENISHDMTSPTFTLCTTMGVGRGGVEAVLGPSLLLKFDIFLLRYMFSKKGCYLVSSGKNEISPFLPTLRKSLASPGKFYYCLPRTQRLINHEQLLNHSALIRFD